MQVRRETIAWVAGLMCAVTLCGQAPAPHVRPPAVLPITSITITGNHSLPSDAILAVAGLKVKDDGGVAIFDAARDRLLDTGYFDTVGYSFRRQDQGIAVGFSVVEMKQVFPLRVEALPITQEQVMQLLKEKDPLFNGLLPGARKVLDRAASLIAQHLDAQNPGIRVGAKVVTVAPERFEVLFTPAAGLPVIADMTFEGSKAAKAEDLHTVMIEHGIGQPFSDTSVRELLDRLIRPVFEKDGYMAVTFPKITSKPDAAVKGIDVHVVVSDGPQFRLGALSVRGAMAGDAARILGFANVARGGIANGDEIAQGAVRIHDSLRGEGYLDAAVSTGQVIHDATLTVDVWFDVEPGALYKFGHLEVNGLGLEGEAAIRRMWTVKPGDPYPAAYPDYFAKSVKDESMFDHLGGITATPSIDARTHVVDVTLNFAFAPTPAPKPMP